MMLTKLEAVNYLLDVLGSPPVANLESLQPDVQTALQKLDMASRFIQRPGMWFNKELCVTFVPDETTKEITLPTDCIKVLGFYDQFVVQRGNKLYDTVNQTYQFDMDIRVDYVAHLEWDLLPESVKDLIMYHAAVQVCTIDLEDSQKANDQRELLQQAMMRVGAEQPEVKRQNALMTPRSLRTRGRLRPYNLRNSSYRVNFPGGGGF